MFGHLAVVRAPLSCAERTSYGAHFCGACHAMAELGGRPAALLTNHDQGVLALLIGAMDSEAESSLRPCTALPWRQVTVRRPGPRARALLAGANVAAIEAKLRDDVDDEGRWTRRLALRLVARLARRARQALGTLGIPLAPFEDLPHTQRAIESQAGATLDALAAPSADLVATCFAEAGRVCGRAELAPALERLGRALGTFVYLWDAVEDRASDRREGCFNAIDAWCGRDGDGAEVGPHLRRVLDDARESLDVLPATPELDIIQTLLDALDERVARRFGLDLRGGGGAGRQRGDCDCCGACCSLDDCCCSNAGDRTAWRCCCSCTDCCACDCGRERKKKRKRRARGVADVPFDEH